VQRGDHVVIVGENRPRLYAAMLAVQSAGGVPVPLYQDAASTEYAFPINNAEVAFAIVEDQEQVDKMLELREGCPTLKRIWFDDPRGLRTTEPGLQPGRAGRGRRTTCRTPPVRREWRPAAVAAMFDQRHHGNPKGVAHPHSR
jgi:long-chain acyl-CoA synthetase